MADHVDHERPLDITALRAGYGRNAVLKCITLRLRRGEWFTLLGPNGVGKSTLLRTVAGQINPSQGSVSICGFSISGDRARALRYLGFGCVPGKLPGLLTGRQCLQVYAAAKDLLHVEPTVLALADGLKFSVYLDQYVDTYSLGTRQKLSVLLALLGRPSLIVLDEAFNGLDPSSALVLKRHLREQVTAGLCSVLLATHALDIVEHFSDRAGLLLDGRIVRVWDERALRAIRSGDAMALERELAAAVEGA